MSIARRAVTLSLTFFVGSALPKLLVFALLPLYTQHLDPSDYGYFDLSVTYATVGMSLLFMDVWVSTLRFMHAATDDVGRNQAVSAGAAMFMLSTLAFCVAAQLLAFFIDIRYLYLILGYGVTANLKEFSGCVARGLNRNVAFSIGGAFNTIVMACSCYCMLTAGAGVKALYIAAVAGNLAQVLLLEPVTAALRSFPITVIDVLRTTTARDLMKFTLPLGVNSIAYWLLTGLGKVAVQHEMSLTDNGYFAVANRFGTLVIVASSVFTMAWQDISFSKQGRQAPMYRSAMNYSLIATGLAVAGILPAVSLMFPVLVHGGYSASYDLVPGFVLSAALGAYSSLLGNVFYALQMTRVVFFSMLASCLLNALLCFPFVAWWGINGANAAVVLSFVLNIAIRTRILGREVDFGLKLRNMLAACACISTGVAVFRFNDPGANVAMLCLTLVGLCWLNRGLLMRIGTSVPAT